MGVATIITQKAGNSITNFSRTIAREGMMMFLNLVKHPVMYVGVLMVEVAAIFVEGSMLVDLFRQYFSFEIHVFFRLLFG